MRSEALMIDEFQNKKRINFFESRNESFRLKLKREPTTRR
jgi:hypothetical protein